MAAHTQDTELAPAEISTFHAWDYVVFSLVLAISAGIGIYHACSGGKQKSREEYLMANRSMSALPVALSVLASFFSASTLLGTPSEIYLEGTMYWTSVFGAICAPLVGAYVFGPFFFRMNVVTVFEYLELRYKSRAVRILGAVLFLFRTVLGMGIVLYGPSTALNAVTGFPIWAGIVVVGAVCCLYTTLGGLKAVIWTDVFQTVIMLMGMLAILIKGAMEVGGIKRAWEIADASGRIEFLDFNPDPTVRHTFWTLVVGNFFAWIYPYTVDQQMIQRFASAKSLKQAKISLLLNIPGMFILITLCSLAGLFMYAYYAECDPLLRGTAGDPNQLMPRFVMDVLGDAPGVPGLFTASLFSGALSSVSSMMNSQAAVTWEDLCKLCFCSQKMSESRATAITKAISVMYAAVGIGAAFVFTNIGGTVLQMSLAFNGAAGAPLVGIFILGCFFPWANWIGAFVGAIVGFVFTMWINLGAYITQPPVTNDYPRSIDGCPRINVTYIWNSSATYWTGVYTEDTSTQAVPAEITGIDKLYTLSYLWYTAVGVLVTVFVGIIVSFMTGYTRPIELDPNLLMCYTNVFWPCLPHEARKRCYCGVDYDKVDKGDEHDDRSETSVGLDKGMHEMDISPEVNVDDIDMDSDFKFEFTSSGTTDKRSQYTGDDTDLNYLNSTVQILPQTTKL